MTEWMTEKARTGSGIFFFPINICLCDQISFILSFLLSLYLAALFLPSLKAKSEGFHAAVVKITCLSLDLCRFG